MNPTKIVYHIFHYFQFSTPGNCQIHKKKHVSEVDKVLCTVCNKQFSTSGNLSIHMRIHNGTKKNRCEVCLKEFLHAGVFNFDFLSLAVFSIVGGIEIERHFSLSNPYKIDLFLASTSFAGLREKVCHSRKIRRKFLN